MPLPENGIETVLPAEDDESVRVLSKEVLEDYGYTVIEAVDGEDAIIKFQENPRSIELLLLDVIMPKKNGVEPNNRLLLLSFPLMALKAFLLGRMLLLKGRDPARGVTVPTESGRLYPLMIRVGGDERGLLA